MGLLNDLLVGDVVDYLRITRELEYHLSQAYDNKMSTSWTGEWTVDRRIVGMIDVCMIDTVTGATSSDSQAEMSRSTTAQHPDIFGTDIGLEESAMAQELGALSPSYVHEKAFN